MSSRQQFAFFASCFAFFLFINFARYISAGLSGVKYSGCAYVRCIINGALPMRKVLVPEIDVPFFSPFFPLARLRLTNYRVYIRWTRQLHETETSRPHASTTITLTAAFTLSHGPRVHAPHATARYMYPRWDFSTLLFSSSESNLMLT